MEYVYLYCGNINCIPKESNTYDRTLTEYEVLEDIIPWVKESNTYDRILTEYEVLEDIIPWVYMTKININWNCPQCIEYMYNCINSFKSKYFLPDYKIHTYSRNTLGLAPPHASRITNYNFLLNNGYYSIYNFYDSMRISKLTSVTKEGALVLSSIEETDFVNGIKEGNLIDVTYNYNCNTQKFDDLIKKLNPLSLFFNKIKSHISNDYYFVEKFPTTKPATKKKYN
jgi:hypothetical protein